MDDLPAEWKPLNFANRPTSEISDMNEMDGLWTFVVSSDDESSSSSAEEELPTPNPQSASKSSLVVPDIPPKQEITTTGANESSVRPRLRSFSDSLGMKRPMMRKKSATVPPGRLGMPDYASQLPRRAISARTVPSAAIRRRIPQQGKTVIEPLIIRGALGDNQWLPRERGRQPRSGIHGSSALLANDAKLPASFSQKARIKKTLDDKNLGRLKTDIIDFESWGLLTSPTSMMNAPRELYAVPEKRPIHDESSCPQSKDARRFIMFSLSGTSPSFRLRRHTPTRNDGAKIRPPGWQQVYLPGAIRLEEHPAKLRKDSVASLDLFAKAIEPRGKRFSDMIVLDSITVFFEDLSVVEDATEQCLDMYWRNAEHAPRHVASITQTSVASVDVAPPPTKSAGLQPVGRTQQGSRFSFSSASSSASQPRTGTPMRQRDKLKRLLSPAFPGSAFLKTPADWGRQQESS
jgi:hypothetical protein